MPVYDERELFEMLVLEGAQAGLSWSTILRKRNGYRAAFDGFDPERVAAYDDAKIAELLALSLIHISEPTRPSSSSYAVFCLKKNNKYTNSTSYINLDYRYSHSNQPNTPSQPNI